jgi:regulator of sigma E protease
MSVEAARSGIESLLMLIAMLSINVAVLNLLPIPILDGGQIVLNIVETVRGGAFSARTREYIARFGLLAIVLLLALGLFNDISSFFRHLLRI